MNAVTNEAVYELQNKYNLSPSETDQITSSFFATYGNYGTEDQLEQHIQAYFFSRRMTGTVNEAEAVKEVDTNNNELRKVPLPAHNRVLRDKKFKYNTFASLMACSNKNIGDVKVMEFSNYLYDNKIDEAIEFIYETTGKHISKRTFNGHVKNIIDSGYDLVGLQNTPNGLAYLLRAEYDGGYFVTIPLIQLKDLLACTNKNMLKLYVFLKDYLKDKEGFATMDRNFIAKSIGLSTNTHKGADIISTMVNGLARLGYIEIKKVNESYVDSDGNKAFRTINSYRLRSLEEWEAIKKQAEGIASKQN